MTQEQSKKSRLAVGAILAAVILGVVAFKIAGQQSRAPLALQSVSTPAPTVPVTRPTSATILGPALPTAAVTSGVDPFPESPAAQVEWVARNKKPALILVHSTTCIPCKLMEQLVGKVRADYEPDVVVVDVIITDRANLDLIRQLGIQAIPTTFLVSSSGQAKRVLGAMKEEALRAELASLKAGS